MSDYRNISIRNKRATYDFEILDTYIAGIVLNGDQVAAPGQSIAHRLLLLFS